MVFLLVGLKVYLCCSIGCSGNERAKILQLNNNDNSRAVTVKCGQLFEISLKGNPTTGYTWEVSPPFDDHLLSQVGALEFKPDSALLGAPGIQVFRFKTLKKGETTLKLVYRRPWEKDVPPLDTFTIKVIIH